MSNSKKKRPLTASRFVQLYDRYTQVLKPQGVKLKATIINFPNGMPGDVGLFLNWVSDDK